MSVLFAAVRAVHFASAMLLFGSLVFVSTVAEPVWRKRDRASPDERNILHRWLFATALWCVIASIVSGVLWLAEGAAVMTGAPLERAVNPDTLALVLGKTVFGRVWILRFCLVISLSALLLAISRTVTDRRKSYLAIGAIFVAAAYLGTLAWAGHAAAGQGLDRTIQIVSDVVHLLAAGAWLGALPGLAFLLVYTQSRAAAVNATRRFSMLGVISVVALVLTGLVNTWYLVDNVPALLGTDYGWLLLAKVALFAMMLILAATNRWRLTPRLATEDHPARRLLLRNALLETALGIVVVIVVGSLGIMVPAAHQTPVWPFNYTLALGRIPPHAVLDSRAVLFAVALMAGACAVVASVGVWERKRRLWLGGLTGIVLACVVALWVLLIPAYPTSYAVSPAPYDVSAIAAGSVLYAQHCSGCHGRYGQGDGSVVASLPKKLPKLDEHGPDHRPGDLFWLLAHGRPQTAMRAFSPPMSDAEIWKLIQFLRAQADAEEARSMTDDVHQWRPVEVVAPDFTFEFPGRGQESLKEQRNRSNTLIVFYTLPQSLSRIRALAAAQPALAATGLRILALSTSLSKPVESESASNSESIFPRASPDVFVAYSMFTRAADKDDGLPAHVEFLIDRQGYLRARWFGVPDDASDRTAEIGRQVEMLAHVRLRAPTEPHAH